MISGIWTRDRDCMQRHKNPINDKTNDNTKTPELPIEPFINR